MHHLKYQAMGLLILLVTLGLFTQTLWGQETSSEAYIKKLLAEGEEIKKLRRNLEAETKTIDLL
jgi:hypothetical protein